MMRNSTNNFSKLLFVIVCSSISCSAISKVYSWKDADGAMHYSQFPREIVEKNAAQSRASRSKADLEDVVKDLSSNGNRNLLDGLDDIVANANNVREPEKVLIRRDPQLLLIEQQLAQQLAQQLVQQQAQELALQKAREAAAQLAAVNAQEQRQTASANKSKRVEQNSFMAGIRKRVNGNNSNSNSNSNSNDKPRQPVLAQASAPAIISQPQPVAPAPTPILKAQASDAKVIVTPNDKFLAAIQNKLKRHANTDKASASAAPLAPALAAKPVVAPTTENKALINSQIASAQQLEPERKRNAPNAFLAGIQNKLKRQQANKPANAVALSQSNVSPASVSNAAQSNAVQSNGDQHNTSELEVVGENQGSGRQNRGDSGKPTTARQVNSALMLSHLSNQQRRLPLAVGTDQLDRQGIHRTSQFVEKINADAQ